MGDRGMKEPGAGVRAVCGAVGACRAGRIVANGKPTHSPREDYPRCSVGWCEMQAGPELGGMGGRYVSSVQFSSVQSSSVQSRSVQFRAPTPPSSRFVCADAIACTHACMHWLATGLQNDARPHASAHCSPQPPPAAATSPTLESPFDGLSHAYNDAQKLLLLLADQCMYSNSSRRGAPA